MFIVAILIPLGFLAIVVIITLARMARRFAPKREAPPPEPVFTMAELQQLLQAGQITQAEFDRLWPLVVERQLPDASRQARGFEIIPTARRAPDGPLKSP